MSDNEVVVMFTRKSSNVQTGNIPAAWIGHTVAEMRGTCEASGCPYFAGKLVGETVCRCYAWQGHARQAFYSVSKAYARNPDNYTLLSALKRAPKSATTLRYSVVGDPSAVGEEAALATVETCKAFGVTLLGYIAGWRQAPWWKGILRASCESKEDMEEALALGWKVTRVAPMDSKKPPEPVGIICPIKLGAKSNCNSCHLCLYTEKTPAVIWFPDHTPLVKAHRAQKAKREAAKLAEEGKPC